MYNNKPCNDGKWVLEFLIKMVLRVGSKETEYTGSKTIQIQLDSANAKNAEKQAMLLIKYFTKAATSRDINFFRQYSDFLDDQDDLSFSNFRIFFEKKLDVQVPEIIASP